VAVTEASTLRAAAAEQEQQCVSLQVKLEQSQQAAAASDASELRLAVQQASEAAREQAAELKELLTSAPCSMFSITLS
jgi:hypothetical protein